MRKPIIIGNWKMNKTIAEAVAFIEAVDGKATNSATWGIATPYLALEASRKKAKNLVIASQNLHFKDNGAYTGEVSAQMLEEIGIEYVIIGHSERRQYFGETDETVNLKTIQALKNNIVPVVCVGETLQEFEAGTTENVVRRQTKNAFVHIEKADMEKVVIAYEPVWAIGTGKTATNEIAQDVCKIIRNEVANLFGQDVADKVRIQYGGSVKPEGLKTLLQQPDIDGALVGGASLVPESYIAMIENLG